MSAKYDTIGKGYNLTRQADDYLTKRLLFHLKPSKTSQYLDIGCGTGNYTDKLQSLGYNFMGIDPSEKMLKKAEVKNKDINWQIGTAEETDLPDAIVDGIIASLTIHHWNDLEIAFKELGRVMRLNGRIVIFTATPKQMTGYWLNHYFPIMMKDSMIQMPSLENVRNAMEKAGLEFSITEKYYMRPDLKDKFLYIGKNNPEVYFDKQIRNGISSFSALAYEGEVKQGLIELRKDIESGKIEKVLDKYENDFGDYLYIVGIKN